MMVPWLLELCGRRGYQIYKAWELGMGLKMDLTVLESLVARLMDKTQPQK